MVNKSPPLKVKIFMRYLRRGVVLTKDNLAKRNWQGNKRCCFCANDETIQHLFFDCHLACAVWSITHATSGLSQPHSISHMFGDWLWGISKEVKPLVLVGAATTCWSLWLCRNDVVFERKPNTYPLQVIYSAIYCLRSWIILQKPTSQEFLVVALQHLALVAKEFFYVAHGWRYSPRIDNH
jgi:hypothetical protein